MTRVGTLVTFDAGSYRATVLLEGAGGGASPGTWVNRAIAAAEMIPGRRVVVAETGFGEMAYVVLAVVA